MSDEKQAAKMLKGHAMKFATSNVELFGLSAFSPGDVVYGLKAATFDKDRLTLVLDPGGAEAPLTVWAPKGVKFVKGDLVIEKAARIRFEGWDVSQHKDLLAIAHATAGLDAKTVSKKPALRMTLKK